MPLYLITNLWKRGKGNVFTFYKPKISILPVARLALVLFWGLNISICNQKVSSKNGFIPSVGFGEEFEDAHDDIPSRPFPQLLTPDLQKRSWKGSQRNQKVSNTLVLGFFPHA